MIQTRHCHFQPFPRNALKGFVEINHGFVIHSLADVRPGEDGCPTAIDFGIRMLHVCAT